MALNIEDKKYYDYKYKQLRYNPNRTLRDYRKENKQLIETFKSENDTSNNSLINHLEIENMAINDLLLVDRRG